MSQGMHGPDADHGYGTNGTNGTNYVPPDQGPGYVPVLLEGAKPLDGGDLRAITAVVMIAVGVAVALAGIYQLAGPGWTTLAGGVICAALGLMLADD